MELEYGEHKRVYWCDVDYLYTKESPEYDKLLGGAVYVFVKAFDVREVLEILLKELAIAKLKPQEIVSVAPYDVEQEWDTEEMREHYLQLFSACNQTGEVVYDDFHAYARE